MTSPLDLAGRAWDAAYAIDDLRGDTGASDWTAEKIRGLIRQDRADDVETLRGIAEALERRLERERAARQEAAEAAGG